MLFFKISIAFEVFEKFCLLAGIKYYPGHCTILNHPQIELE